MITFACDKCDRKLEVDDNLAGTKVQCPFCSDVNVVPRMAAAAAGSAGAPAAAARKANPDRAEAMGLPPDSGPEVEVMKVHPAMFRARPLLGLLLWTAIIGGGAVGVLALVGTAGLGFPVAVAGFIACGIGLLVLAVWKVAAIGTMLTITNKRTVVRRGLLSKATREMLHDRVQDIQITQSFFERIWRVGTIGLSSSGEAGIEIEVAGIPNPARIREIIDAYRG